MLDLKALLAKILDALKVDYIVEEGTTNDGHGRYKHWNSGRAEVWWHFNVTGVTTNAWTSPVYYQDSSSFGSIWSGVFNGAPFFVNASSNGSQIISIIPMSYNANGIIILRYVSINKQTGFTCPTSIYAEGTWK